MTAPRTGARAVRSTRPVLLLRLLAIAVSPLALAGFGLAPSTTAPPHPVSVAADASSVSSGPQSLRLPGLHGSSVTVTLITGDQIRLTAAGSGRYTATADLTPATGSSPLVRFTGRSDPNGVSRLYAKPLAAEALIDSGQLNPGLFDLGYLAAHGDTRPNATLPLIIRYAGHLSAATLTAKAHNLAGAAVQQTLPATSEVKVSVSAGKASAFWTALTGSTATRPAWPAAAAHLSDGATGVWLDGHRAPALTTHYHPAAAQPPAATVTEVITKKNGPATEFLGCVGSPGLLPLKTLCLGTPSLEGVTGAGAGAAYGATTATCIDDPCTTYQVRFDVPPGIYSAGSYGVFPGSGAGSGRLQTVDIVDPQFTVAGDTTVTIDVDAAQQLTVSGPQPTAYDSFYATVGHYRSLPDGRAFFGFSQGGYGFQNYWFTTGGGQATVGTFHLLNAILTGAPPVTMAVTTPRRAELHPMYPFYGERGDTRPFVRFSGQHTLAVVDAGYGQDSDFAGLDVRGKLVLLRLYRAKLEENVCGVAPELQRALRAGAAGVLIDPSNAKSAVDPQYTYECGVAVSPDWWFDPGTTLVDIPYVGIPPDEASTLRQQLARGSVRITVADSGPAKYLYAVSPTAEGHLPASEHYAFTSQQLTAIDDNFHATQPDTLQQPLWAAFRPTDRFGPSGLYEADLHAPGSVREYIGPDSPDVVWWRVLPVGRSFDVFAQHGGSRTDDWSTPPVAPGTPAGIYDALLQAQPGIWNLPGNTQICAACRQGNTFYPIFYGVAGALPRVGAGLFAYPVGSTGVHLFNAAGNEIPQADYHGLATFALPSQSDRYRLTTADGDTNTAWNFTSSEPATDQSPDGFSCIDTLFSGSTTPCRADPLVFLRYNAFVSLTNTVTAPGTHKLQVTGYHQDPNAPVVTSMQLSISTDGGTSWHQLRLSKPGNGTWQATYTLPPLSATNGYVSIKAAARDRAGNDVNQTILNAYKLDAAVRANPERSS